MYFSEHKACFYHDLAYYDLAYYNITKSPNNDGYQRGLASMVYKPFDEKSEGANKIIASVIKI